MNRSRLAALTGAAALLATLGLAGCSDDGAGTASGSGSGSGSTGSTGSTGSGSASH
jgi:hypothetical protein